MIDYIEIRYIEYWFIRTSG